MEKIKVLHILKSSIYSGAENVVCTIISNMPDNFECLYMSAKGQIEYKLNELAIPHVCVDVVDVLAIREMIISFAPDIIHAHDFSASFMAARAVGNAQAPNLGGRVRVVCHFHNNWPWCKKINPKTIAFKMVSKNIDRILVVSSSVKDEFVFKKVFKDAVVVGNPFDKDKVVQQATRVPDGVDESAIGDYDVILLGRLTQQKQPIAFIDMIDSLRYQKEDIKAVVVGAGELYDDCVIKTKQLGLENNIEFTGFVENPYLYLKKSKVCMMPSAWEGFGLVALEAMSLGKPVVATAVGGLKDIVTQECGLVCTGFSEMMDEAMKLLTDEEYYDLKSSAAVLRAQEYSNINNYIDVIVKNYR